MPTPDILDISESVLLLRQLGFAGGTVRSQPRAEISTHRRRIRDLHIGFDLGTSCTKVVVGDPEAGDSYPVCFGAERMGIERYLLPTRFEESADGAVEFGAARSSLSVHNLKWRAMEAARHGEEIERATEDLSVFLALSVRYVLSWFDRHLAGQYRDCDICWHANFGFPDRRADGTLLGIYEQAARAALTLASGAGPVSRRRIAEAIRAPSGLAARASAFSPERTHFYPEIAAQLAGYARSRFRRDGNLLFIDVGAGTLDISTLIIHRQGLSDRCSFHFCAVHPLGALRLFHSRRSHLERHWNGGLRQFDACLEDGLLPPPDSLDEFLANVGAPPPEIRGGFAEVSWDFGERCRHAILQVLAPFRRSLRDAHSDPGHDPWPTTLRCIRSGGGSRVPFFQDALGSRLEEAMVPFTRWHTDGLERQRLGQGLEFVPLPTPEDLRADDPVVRDQFDRISVAHGLASGIENLMDVTAGVGGVGYPP